MLKQARNRASVQIVLTVGVGREGRVAVSPQRDVEVHRVARLISVGLGHERGDRAALPGELPHPVLQTRRLIGCLEGFQTQGTAQSVGERTTSSVVQTISLVILIDAFAAMFFLEMDW